MHACGVMHPIAETELDCWSQSRRMDLYVEERDGTRGTETVPSNEANERNEPAASRGGQAVVEKYGREYMSKLGRRGSHAVIRRYGLRFYSEIAARNKGVKKRRRTDEHTP